MSKVENMMEMSLESDADLGEEWNLTFMLCVMGNHSVIFSRGSTFFVVTTLESSL